MVNLPSPIQEIQHPLLYEKGITLLVKREDLIHPEIMGNKWRKLKYNLEEARIRGLDSIVTMGGAFSNHIYAVAAAGRTFGFKTTGIIRGDELSTDSNDTLQFASKCGMNLEFVSRTAYREYRNNPALISENYSDSYFLPEGGTNELAVKGCAEITSEITEPYDLIISPIGTGGTFCGTMQGLSASKQALGISCLKGSFMIEEIKKICAKFKISHESYQVNIDYHFGGYGKSTEVLIDFINWFKENFNIQLDPIYTGKTFFAVWDMIKTDKFEQNLRIVLLHTGGLQGISGFNRKKPIIIQ